MRVVAEAYWRQLATIKNFMHEHPARSESRNMSDIQALAADPHAHSTWTNVLLGHAAARL